MWRADNGPGERSEAERPGESFTVSPAARRERLERRIAGVERQLAVRIENEADLRRQVAHLQGELALADGGTESAEARRLLEDARARQSELDAELASTRAQLAASQAELNALLNTKTMRLARRPRLLYQDLRANPTARRMLSRLRL